MELTPAEKSRLTSQRLGRELAEKQMASPAWANIVVDAFDEFGIPQPPSKGPFTPRCTGGSDFRPCRRWAGMRTLHPGIGACYSHERTKKEKALGAWTMAHLIAQALDISPWEALLLAVRRAAAWSAFYEMKLSQVSDDDALRPGGEAWEWVQSAERTTQAMARYAKMAVDAGVAAMLVQQARNEGTQIAQILNAALGAVELSIEQETAIRSALRTALMQLETQAVQDGKVVDGSEEYE